VPADQPDIGITAREPGLRVQAAEGYGSKSTSRLAALVAHGLWSPPSSRGVPKVHPASAGSPITYI